MNPRRLYRSRIDRTIAGVAGGMAEYLEVDPTIVRILWILAAIFTGGLMLLLYILLAFVVPTNPYPGRPMPAGAGYAPGAPAGWGQPPSAPGSTTWSPDWNAQYEAERAARAERPGRAGLIIGTVLIVFGVIALLDVALPSWVGGALFGPALLLAIGAALLVVSLRKPDVQVAAPAATAAGSATYGATAPAAPAYKAPSYEAPAQASEAPVVPAPPALATTPVDDPDATAPVPALTESDPT